MALSELGRGSDYGSGVPEVKSEGIDLAAKKLLVLGEGASGVDHNLYLQVLKANEAAAAAMETGDVVVGGTK